MHGPPPSALNLLPPLDSHTVGSSAIRAPGFRLDASYYRRDFAEAVRRVTGMPTRKLRDIADAFVPERIRLVTVPSPNAGAPYLRAHDAFDIRPSSFRYVARARTRNYERLLLRKGMILTPSSGRNLGPVTYVSNYLSRFAMTDIMRIVPKSEDTGFYLLAYLLTPTAQALIQRGRSGTTVDHLAPEDILNIDVPWFNDEQVRSEIVDGMRHAEQLLDEARRGLDEATHKLHTQARLPMKPPDGEYLSRECGDAFSHSSGELGLRIDAASHDPGVLLCAETVTKVGGINLSSAAQLKTLERYVRYYVEPPNGRPVLSGRQMLQLRPVNLRRISDRSFKDPSKFVLKAGSTIFTCDGRSEEALGTPAYVLPIWDGWMASEHVMRVEPTQELGHGYLYLTLTSPWVQKQLKARATGSVIDALEPEEIANIIIPLLPEAQRLTLDKEVERCWLLISNAVSLSSKIAQRFEAMMA